MSSNNDIIADALRMLGVIAETEVPSAEQGSLGLRRLNQMLSVWDARPLGISWAAQASESDPFPLDASVELAVASNLAVVLARDYGRSVPPEIVKLAMDEEARLLREAAVYALEEADVTNIPLGQLGAWYDITRG